MSEPAPPWVDGLTIGQVLRRTAKRLPQRIAYSFPQHGFRCTYAELDALVDDVARSLIALGLQRGEHAAVWATNWPQWVLLQFATARIGVVMVTVNPAYRSHELAYVLKQSDTKALFLIERFKGADYFALVQQAVPELASTPPGELQSAAYPTLREVVSFNERAAPGMRTWSDFIALGRSVPAEVLAARESELGATDSINIQYTSGTTGFPKGATLSHRNILLNGYYVGDSQRLTADDCICVPVPFYHCFGCVLGVLCAVTHGAMILVPHEHFVAEATLSAMEHERATAVYGVPTMFIALLDHVSFSQRDLHSLRTGVMAGSPCPIELMQRVVRDMGAAELTIAYGLTEFSPVITQTRTEDPLDLRVRTVGRPLPGVEVKIIDPATGQTLPDEQPGELCARGHGTMLGYYKMPEQTAQAIDPEGWLHSGDLGTRMPNGYFRIVGRIKDVVIRGGENIYPREIEEFFYTHPQIQDVAVVGVPDPKFIEEIAAWIKLKPGCTSSESEMRQFCDGKLARYKIPRYVRFVEQFPQTVTGKIQKYKIREAMIEELGLTRAAQREMA